MSGLFIVLDGLDCVGKSTIAKLLAEKLKGVYVSTPPEPFLAECRQIDKNGVIFNEARFNFFVKTVIYSSQEVMEIVAEGTVAIVDRWIWTTLAYHFAANPALYEKYKNMWHDLLAPLYPSNLSILIHINDEQVWRKRMTKREPSKCDNIILRDHKLRTDIYRLFLEFNPDFKLVDNSRSVEDTLISIMALMP